MPTNNRGDYQLLSRQRKPTTDLSTEILKAPKILSKRETRSNSLHVCGHGIVYNRFIRDLEKEIKVYVKQTVRENRFNTRTTRSSDTNSPIQTMITAVASTQTASTIRTHQSNDNETLLSYLSNRQETHPRIRNTETKRLLADVQTILNGPAMKTFYAQFIQSSQKCRQQQDPWQQLLLRASEQQ